MELAHSEPITQPTPIESINKENVEPEQEQEQLKDAAKKNVVFSPNHLKSCLSTPRKMTTTPKSILKTPSKTAPTFYAYSNSTKTTSSPTTTHIGIDNTIHLPLPISIQNGSLNMAASQDFILEAVTILGEGSVEDREKTYRTLHVRFRAGDDEAYLNSLEDTIDEFTMALKRDIQDENAEL